MSDDDQRGNRNMYGEPHRNAARGGGSGRPAGRIPVRRRRTFENRTWWRRRPRVSTGNEVAETGGGWPDADSVFVRLRDPFRTKPLPLPAGIVYTEPNDPHWWKADYTSSAPRHTLACW